MERIEALIAKLKQQYEQHADHNLLLGTVQLLQFELMKSTASSRQTLGTAKVAVTLPAFTAAGVSEADYEKFAPRPVAKEEPVAAPAEAKPEPVVYKAPQPEMHLPEQPVFLEPATPSTEEKEIFQLEHINDDGELVQDVKETLLVDDGNLSVVQKNGQLDMVFDPLNEIPTLSQQMPPETKRSEVNEAASLAESLNDKLKQGKTELIEVLKETPVKDLRKAVGINDRFLFINELFRGDETMYERSIKTINSFNIYPEAEYWISRELKLKLGWNMESATVRQFDQLVRRRFS